MGRCSMAEWRWEQEDAAIIQKIMRGFLIRKEQKVTFKKVTTKWRFAPGVGGVSPLLKYRDFQNHQNLHLNLGLQPDIQYILCA